MFADYHTHTPLCKHATGSPEEYVHAAIERGLQEYGISDHAPAQPEPFDDWRMLESELPAYFEFIDKAKEAAGDRLDVRAGLECDWLKGCEPWMESLRSRYDWDYFIGSVHYIGDQWDFDNPVWIGRWKQTDVEEVWSQYWATYQAMAKSGLFEILGHSDLIKKFNFFPEGGLDRFYIPTVEAIADSGASIEINTAGWYKDCKEQYPAFRFLELASEANISLTINSDAHSPSEIGREFEQALSLAKRAGFKELALFEKGKRTLVPM